MTATQRTLPGRAASRAVLEVPQSYIDLQTLKAAGLRVWLTNRRNLGAEILPLGTVTDRCWHILNYWKLLKNNRLLEKHKGLRDARAGAGASGQAALPRGPPHQHWGAWLLQLLCGNNREIEEYVPNKRTR